MLSGDTGTAAPRPRADAAGLCISAGLFAVAALIVWDAAYLPGSVYGVGPAAMSYIVAAGLAALGVGNLVQAVRGQLPPREDLDASAILLILGGLAGLILIIGLGGGFILAVAVLFAATATAMGRRRLAMDFAIGLSIGLVVYVTFAKGLALSLPAGPLESLI